MDTLSKMHVENRARWYPNISNLYLVISFYFYISSVEGDYWNIMYTDYSNSGCLVRPHLFKLTLQDCGPSDWSRSQRKRWLSFNKNSCVHDHRRHFICKSLAASPFPTTIKMAVRSDLTSFLLCNIYRLVGRSIADISDLRRHIYRGAKRHGKYATEVGYRGYGPPYHTIVHSPRIPNFESCNSDSMIVSEQDWCMLCKDHMYGLLRGMF